MNKTNVIAACIAVVLTVSVVMAGIAYNVQQGTEKRRDCAEAGGSWTINSQCLRFVQVTE